MVKFINKIKTKALFSFIFYSLILILIEILMYNAQVYIVQEVLFFNHCDKKLKQTVRSLSERAGCQTLAEHVPGENQ